MRRRGGGGGGGGGEDEEEERPAAGSGGAGLTLTAEVCGALTPSSTDAILFITSSSSSTCSPISGTELSITWRHDDETLRPRGGRRRPTSSTSRRGTGNIRGDDVIVFLHIQKTGGTTFGRHLVQKHRPGAAVRVPAAPRSGGAVEDDDDKGEGNRKGGEGGAGAAGGGGGDVVHVAVLTLLHGLERRPARRLDQADELRAGAHEPLRPEKEEEEEEDDEERGQQQQQPQQRAASASITACTQTIVDMNQGYAGSSKVPVVVTVARLAAGPPPGVPGWMITQGAVLQSADRREDTAPGNGLHESEGPERSLLSSSRADRKAITIYIPAQAGAGKLQVAGVETWTPVLPPQGREGNPTTFMIVPVQVESPRTAGPPVGPYLGYLEPEVRDNVGLVVAQSRRKLAPHWKGPYLIQQRMVRDDEVGVTYRLSSPFGDEPPLQTVHYDRLRRYSLPVAISFGRPTKGPFTFSQLLHYRRVLPAPLARSFLNGTWTVARKLRLAPLTPLSMLLPRLESLGLGDLYGPLSPSWTM
ncbi:hypothetical protein CRUP_026758, partial [Coryphaenoides rupestris]